MRRAAQLLSDAKVFAQERFFFARKVQMPEGDRANAARKPRELARKAKVSRRRVVESQAQGPSSRALG